MIKEKDSRREKHPEIPVPKFHTYFLGFIVAPGPHFFGIVNSPFLPFCDIKNKRDLVKSNTQVGLSELRKTADDRVNIGGTIFGAPIEG